MEWEVIAPAFACIIFTVFVAVMIGLLLSCLKKKFKYLPPKCEGFAAPGWNRVAEMFEKHAEGWQNRGGGFVVYHKGQLVVEFVGGYADYEAELPWDKNTLSCLYGCTKGIGAIVIAILVDRGLLDYSAPVAKYWPEFASNGKESITVEQLLSHQAGLIVLDENYTFFDIVKKPERMSYLLASAQPQWVPGSDHGFHSMTMGLYMDQLVRRVDPKRRSLAQFFAEEIARKFGIDSFIGLPREENHRCARPEWSLNAFFDLFKSSKYWVCEREDDMDKNIGKMMDNVVETEKIWDDIPAFREIPCASTHGFATAAGLAKLYGILANGGRHENQTLLSPSAVGKLNEPLVSGIDAVCCLDSTFGRGTIIMRSKDGHNIFGHPGFCVQAGFADPKHRLGWAYITNYPSIFFYADDWNYRQLIDMVYETVKELER